MRRFNPHFINIAVSGFEKHDDDHKKGGCLCAHAVYEHEPRGC